MKRFLSVLLSLALVFSCTSALAQRDEVQSFEEIDASALSSAEMQVNEDEPTSLDLEAYADSTQSEGYFESLVKFRTYEQTFEDEGNTNPIGVRYSKEHKDNYILYIARSTGKQNGATSAEDGRTIAAVPVFGYSYDGGLSANNRYLVIKHTGQAIDPSGQSKVYYSSTVGPDLKFMNMQTGEKVHISYYIKTGDFAYNKTIDNTYQNELNKAIGLIQLGADGNMTFAYDDSTNKKSIPYSLNRWYKIDMVYTKNAEGTNDRVDLYLNNKHITYTEKSNFMNISNNQPIRYVRFRINSTDTDYAEDSNICVDNIKAQFYSASASASVPTITQNKFAYLGFEGMKSAEVGADGFVGAGSSYASNYTSVNGVYSKESNDTSVKINGASINAYELDITNIKKNTELAVGEQLKISSSYAYSGGEGTDSLALTGTGSPETLYEIDRSTGVLTAVGSTESFTLNSEKWYNIDTILTVKDGYKLGYKIYVNGKEVISDGELDADSLKGSTAAEISKASFVLGGSAGDSFIDDVYVEYFSGTESDKAAANAPIEAYINNVNVDISQNGTIIVPASYNVGNIIADITGGGDEVKVKVIKDNAKVESGSAENALIAVGELCPVYAYTFVKAKLEAPSITFGTGTADITAMIVNNSTPIDITLIAAVYTAGGQIYSIKSQYQNCSAQNTDFAISISDLPAGASIKVFTVQGWSGKLPIFEDMMVTQTN